MSSYILYVVLLSIWNVVLFFNKTYGISVILFMIPLLLLILCIFKKKNLIKDKKGLLFMIPILLLSISYSIYESSLFYILNILVIPILFLLMYIYTIKPSRDILQVLPEMGYLLFEPIAQIGNYYKSVKDSFNKSKGISNKTKKNLKSLLIIIPIVVVILALLMSADSIFKGLFSGLIDITNKLELLNNILGKIVIFIVVFTYLGATLLTLIEKYIDSKRVESKPIIKDANTIKILMVILNVIYVVFDFIQIKDLMLKNVSSGFDYATYARQGFFELLAVSIINISIILLSKNYKTNDKKENKFININGILMVLLTIVIIISSFMRMNLYESVYGYTMLRLLVYVSLITEAILMIPTIIYIVNPKVSILKYYIAIIISVYTIINFINFDYIIARRNVDRYYASGMKVSTLNSDIRADFYHNVTMYKYPKLDLNYLETFTADNIDVLLELYYKTNDPYMIEALNAYFDIYVERQKELSWQEYNISKSNAYEKLKNYKRINPRFN